MDEMMVLVMSAASLGFIHTLLGPDHYLPFIVLSRARNWTQSRTMWITLISGFGHVAGSVVLGLVGVAMGLSLTRMEEIESGRGGIVGWMLLGFGVLYMFYGLYKFFKKSAHVHLPAFLRPRAIRHDHLHLEEHAVKENDAGNLTPWIIFLIFVFGPCEVLIPMLIYPASQHSAMGVFLVALVFGTATIVTMMTVVLLGYKGVSMLRFRGREHWMHLAAGFVIFFAGFGMTFLGW